MKQNHQQSNHKNSGKNFFIISRQPIRKVNIKISILGIRIFPGDNRKRARHFKDYKYQCCQKNRDYGNPCQKVYFIEKTTINNIKNYRNKKYPD